SMSYNIMVIAEGRPQQLGLIPILRYYVEHQRNVVLRRTKFDLNNNKKRAHILEGYSLILGNIDEVIAIIKGSRTRTEAITIMLYDIDVCNEVFLYKYSRIFCASSPFLSFIASLIPFLSDSSIISVIPFNNAFLPFFSISFSFASFI
ncbi:MAG: hypothetical protein K5765_00180, partial [Clostridia bacterium]|nr:hypothetical protein [Clostridia bacterium]